ncbi:MAG: MFS transporter [Acidimicrobiales bacterium]
MTSTGQVVGARVVMGVGAGLVMPATLSIITAVFPPGERVKAIAVWVSFAGAGGALGPVVSGLVLELWDWELRSPHPMLDPRFFRIPAFSTGSATITVIFFVMFGMFFLIPKYLQFVQGHGPLGAAIRMLPSGLTMIVVAPRGPAFAARVGPYHSTGLGLLGAAAGFVVLSRLGPDAGYPVAVRIPGSTP